MEIWEEHGRMAPVLRVTALGLRFLWKGALGRGRGTGLRVRDLGFGLHS